MSTQAKTVRVRNTSRSKYVLGALVLGDASGNGSAPAEVDMDAKAWADLKTDKRYGATVAGLLKSGELVEYGV